MCFSAWTPPRNGSSPSTSSTTSGRCSGGATGRPTRTTSCCTPPTPRATTGRRSAPPRTGRGGVAVLARLRRARPRRAGAPPRAPLSRALRAARPRRLGPRLRARGARAGAAARRPRRRGRGAPAARGGGPGRGRGGSRAARSRPGDDLALPGAALSAMDMTSGHSPTLGWGPAPTTNASARTRTRESRLRADFVTIHPQRLARREAPPAADPGSPRSGLLGTFVPGPRPRPDAGRAPARGAKATWSR